MGEKSAEPEGCQANHSFFEAYQASRISRFVIVVRVLFFCRSNVQGAARDKGIGYFISFVSCIFSCDHFTAHP
jgi:hypothetical protein